MPSEGPCPAGRQPTRITSLNCCGVRPNTGNNILTQATVFSISLWVTHQQTMLPSGCCQPGFYSDLWTTGHVLAPPQAYCKHGCFNLCTADVCGAFLERGIPHTRRGWDSKAPTVAAASLEVCLRNTLWDGVHGVAFSLGGKHLREVLTQQEDANVGNRALTPKGLFGFSHQWKGSGPHSHQSPAAFFNHSPHFLPASRMDYRDECVMEIPG